MSRRWPAHPPPRPGEALSSWLGRIAAVYRMSLKELVGHNLAIASFNLDDPSTLDLDPLAGVLEALHERTGVPLADLQHMTAAGWVPWLLDSFDDTDPDAFDTYVRQDSVLFGPAQRPGGLPARPARVFPWRPWLPALPNRRGCVDCMAAKGRHYPLLSQLPLMVSCPEHSSRLIDRLDPYILEYPQFLPDTTISEPIVAMDRLTWEGLTTGVVTLPQRQVHVGVWLRMLRILLDELNTLSYQLRPAAQNTMRTIWDVHDLPPRGGAFPWRPYETMPRHRQDIMFEAAATALRLAISGEIKAGGTLAETLQQPVHPPVYDGDPNDFIWQWARNDLRGFFDAACQDHLTALRLMRLRTWRYRSPLTYDECRQEMIWYGIPEQFLPRTQEDLAGVLALAELRHRDGLSTGLQSVR